MTEKIRFRLNVITIPALVNSAITLILYSQFLRNGTGNALLVIIAQAVLVPVILNIILSGKVKLFDEKAIPPKKEKEKYEKYLKILSSSPLKTLEIVLLISLVSITVLALYLVFFTSIGSIYVIAYSILVLACLMLSAGFSYILLDNLIIMFLSSRGLFVYSDTMLIQRQKSKHIIIPLFMTFMSLLFASSLTLLLLLKIDTTAMASVDLIKTILISSTPYYLVFLGVAAPLVLRWAKNTSLLYRIVNNRLEEMVSSEKDLTKRINISSVDEFATLSHRINKFSDIICDHLQKTGSMFENLNSYQNELFENVSKSSDSVTDIADNITSLTDTINDESESVKAALETGMLLSQNLSQIVNHIDEQSKSVSESSAAVEEMIASISEVSGRTGNVKGKTREISQVFEVGQEKIEKTVSSVSNVVEFSKSLIEINTLISGIAAQTNLLAMNAAIEAAHAGEAGRGFSVVADEIRKLAENTAIHTKTSSDNLKKILSEIDISLTVAEETGQIFNKMKEGIQIIDNETISISESMVEHDTANKLVLEQLMDTKNMTGNLTNIAVTISDQEKSMMKSLQILEVNSDNSIKHCREISVKNTTVKDNVTNLISIAGKTGEISNNTMDLVKSFKVE